MFLSLFYRTRDPEMVLMTRFVLGPFLGSLFRIDRLDLHVH